MGSGCYRIANRELFFVGGWCENNCFKNYGGCEASINADITKEHETCELRPDDFSKMNHTMKQVNKVVGKVTQKGKSIFLYTPDMYSDFYYENCFNRLKNRNGSTYIAINAGVRTLTDKVENHWQSILDKGIKEIWIGVESAEPLLRDKYNKPEFTNDEVVEITKKGHLLGVNICWFLVDGDEDTEITRLKTYNLIKEAQPYRIHIGDLRAY